MDASYAGKPKGTPPYLGYSRLDTYPFTAALRSLDRGEQPLAEILFSRAVSTYESKRVSTLLKPRAKKK